MSGSEDLVLQRQIEIAQYVCAGSAAVYVWDILNNVRSDWSLFFKHKSNAVAVAYPMARIGALVFVLGFTVFASHPFTYCNKVLLVINSFLPVTVCGTSSLFLYRVWTVYGGDRIVTLIFGCLWLFAVGSAITIPIGESAERIDGPLICVISRVESYIGASAIILTVQKYDHLPRDLVSNDEGGKSDRPRGIHSANFLRSLYRDGQMNYLIVVLMNIPATLLLYISSVPTVYRGLFVVPNITLTSVMACRIYRDKVLGVRRSPQLTLPTLNHTTNTIPLSVVRFQHTDVTSSLHMDSDESNFTRGKGSVPESSLDPRSKSDGGSYPSDTQLNIGVS
ncbi:hypothetical protein MSAN_01646600 [Mycena sanguinolenta]|uniref:Transmembrane protein n=1 Tax=Mycena sanguinolenta TaxID=230812 RepID=A0A8H7CWR2_9AGAR|nr:hypothetical protein MSAN_01646600 [Mycena sanguinolenta]